MDGTSPQPKGSFKRLLVPLGLLALYPLLILALQIAEAPEPSEVSMDLSFTAERIPGQPVALSVEARNGEARPVELGMLMINVMRAEQPERTIIEDRPALARRLGGQPVLEANSSAGLGRYVLGFEEAIPGEVVIQVSLNLIHPDTGEPRQVTLEVPWAEIAASD
jgi:hypothetical protein